VAWLRSTFGICDLESCSIRLDTYHSCKDDATIEAVGGHADVYISSISMDAASVLLCYSSALVSTVAGMSATDVPAIVALRMANAARAIQPECVNVNCRLYGAVSGFLMEPATQPREKCRLISYVRNPSSIK
jgi:hypothetical protein